MYPINLTKVTSARPMCPCACCLSSVRPTPFFPLSVWLGLLVLLGKTTASRTAYEKKWALVVNTFSHFRQNLFLNYTDLLFVDFVLEGLQSFTERGQLRREELERLLMRGVARLLAGELHLEVVGVLYVLRDVRE